jgi:hypothetical protein
MAKEVHTRRVEAGSVDELSHIVLLALRYIGVPQGTLVHDLSALGLAPTRIAHLLGAPPKSVTSQKAQKRPDWPR